MQEDAAGKLDLTFADMGEQQLRNIARPVRTYAVILNGAITIGQPSLALPNKPSGSVSPRSVIEKFAAMQMIDVHVPTTDGRELRLTLYTEPDAELRLLLDKLKLALPAQSPPKITTAQIAPQPPP